MVLLERIAAGERRLAALIAEKPRSFLALCISLASLSCLGAFHLALRGIDPASYAVRDDAVITLSHARNLIDFGFVGVNPSGERVEGFSAPLQFVLYALAYASSGLGYRTFFELQIGICNLLLGALLFFAFELFGKQPLRSLALSIFCSVLLTRSSAFLLWHSSGMENALQHCLYLASLIGLVLFIREPRARAWLLPLLVCASWIRDESILHILPLLLVVLLFRRDRPALRLFGGFAALWLGLFFLKSLYFGDSKPNTAYAQLLQPSAALLAMLHAQLPWDRTRSALTSLGANLALLPFLALPVLWRAPREKALQAVLGSFIAIAIFGLLQGLLFGPARMDPARTTTFVAVFAVVALGAILLCSKLPFWLSGVLALVLLSPPIARVLPSQPYVIGWGAAVFEAEEAPFARIALEEDLPRPFLANPDLGALSWTKWFNIIDLGFLGSDVLAKMETTQDTADYLLEIARPDLIQLGGHWSCLYWFLQADPRFTALYQSFDAHRSVYLQESCPAHANALDGIWIRRAIRKGSDDRERAFLDQLRTSLDPRRIELELSRCPSARAEDCLYALRTVYRLLPELRRAGFQDRVREIFSRSGPLAFRDWSVALLRSREDGQLKDSAMELLSAIRSERAPPFDPSGALQPGSR